MNAPENASLVDPALQLTRWLEGTDIGRLELTGPGLHIVLTRQAPGTTASAPVASPVAVASSSSSPTSPTGSAIVRAGSVGVLRLAHPCRDKPLVSVGQTVVAGQPMALLQIGLVLLPVTAPHAGVVTHITGVDGAKTGYGDPLFTLA